ncbi:alpha/beta hydrolase [Parafrankia sp. BMG5.11]|uniref:alpha/beta hydrolase n=1 Tax=Parafrankia sp. BMG5.11 TaxID=222540 RepID=UPI0027D27B06|nr:alpha/beta hydrolase [Parafrankia sp. BMG5.11]
MIAARDAAIRPRLVDRASRIAADVEEIDLGGVGTFVITPRGAPDNERVFLDIHGGGLIMGGGDLCRAMGVSTAARVHARTWAIDYRMPPDHPYPTPLDDCLAAYRALLRDHRPESIVVGGGSAGGNLAAALVLRARDEGLPMPAAVVLLTPELDLTESGDSFQTNLGVDTVQTDSLMPANLLYAAGHDLSDPYLSPLFGDFSAGFPPTLLATGTRDIFLSNTVRMHRALRAVGGSAELHVLEAAPHGGFFGSAPEDRELEREVRRFIHTQWALSL